MENQNNEKEITLGHIFEVLKKNLVLIIIAAIVCAGIGVVYATVLDKPQYKAEASFFVNTSPESSDYISQTLTAASADLASSFTELVKEPLLVRKAIKNFNLTEELGYDSEDDCVKAVTRMLKAYKTDTNSTLFYISVTTSDREVAYKVMNAIQNTMPGEIKALCEEKVNVTLTGEVNGTAAVTVMKSSPITMALIGGVAGAILVYAIFFIVSLFDTAVYDENTIKNNFSYPIVGYIPSFCTKDNEKKKSKLFKTSKKGPAIAARNYDSKLIGESSPFLVNEAFNNLRTNLVYAAVAEKNPIFAVTSDIAGAGKTVVSANLAISFANLGKKVLLVECDMRCPAFSKLFKVREERGLSDLLAGIYDKTEDVAVRVGKENLDVVFCGNIPPNPSELLSGFRMAELAQEWKNTYDYIILDMPPIGEVFDAGVVAKIVNGYVIAVRCNYSDVVGVRDSAHKVETVNGNILGIVLNDINPKSNKKYKYYSSYADSEKSK